MAAHCWRIGLIALLVAQMQGAAMAAETLRNLPPADKPRFAVTDRTWPAEVGEASVCLWSKDKLAAVSITIDDNWVSDHPWWLEIGETYGMRFTWFVIAGRLSPKGGFFGSPADFAQLRAAGHDVQSHTVDHFSSRPPSASLDTDANYRQAIGMLEKEVAGARILALAYPGGANAKNDRSLAEKYYIAARGTRGHLNSASQVDYMDVNSLSGSMPLDADHWAGLPNLITLNPKRPTVYRGWACVHYHGTENLKQPTGEARKKIVESLNYLKQNAEAFWVVPFVEIAQYGQERDTATVAVRRVGAGEWELIVSDQMDDRWFDFPLTVKLRVEDSWSKLNAQQNGAPAQAALIEHGGRKYALVQAVPDRGVLTLTGE